jgi:signal transduction histidine kinase
MGRGRPRRGALGLRGRIVGAVLVTAVATLAVAAVALLGPLEQSLRSAAKKTLVHDVKLAGATSAFRRIDLTYVAEYPPDPNARAGHIERGQVQQQEQTLARRIGASVTLLGFPDATSHGRPVLTPRDVVPSEFDPYNDAAQTFRTGKTVYSFGSVDGTDYARAALPIRPGYVLAIRRPIDEIPGAVHAVRTAFLTAALVALALTLIFGIPLSATLVRRLRRLRQAALQLAREGPSVDVPVDRARDEVGDLARTFALMQAQLQHQEEARRAFVATASHELRTPLASLDGMLELLDEDLCSGAPDLEDARSLLERARAQSRRLGRLAADLLDLSRLDAEVQLRSEPVELVELSRAVLAEFELGTDERGITPLLDDSVGPVWALGDPGSVARILRILLDNAVRFSPPGGAIKVELHNGGRASLSVQDEGPGVPRGERELIFERFQRGSVTTGGAGFGLGLAIGRQLAERMGGELVLEQLDGPGARFTLRLPETRAAEEDPVALV